MKIKLFEIITKIKQKNIFSIRFQFFCNFLLCSIISILIFIGNISIINYFNKEVIVEYNDDLFRIAKIITKMSVKIPNRGFKITDKNIMEILIEDLSKEIHRDAKISFVDMDGNVLYKTSNVEESKIDLYKLFKERHEFYKYITHSYEENGYILENPGEITTSIAIPFPDDVYILTCKVTPVGVKKDIIYSDFKIVLLSGSISLIFFLIFFYILSNRKILYIREISKGLIHISQGNLNYEIPQKGHDELSSLVQNVNHMSKQLKKQIEEEKQLEDAKNEIIANVSHDLRTPLTSIIGYLGLLKKKQYKTEEQLNKYIAISFDKSEKLKILIDELFEYVKLSQRVTKFKINKVILNDLVEQTIEAYIPIFEENDLEIELDISKENIILDLDPYKTVRVFENLFMNAIKYSFKPSKVRIKVYKEENTAVVCIENKGKEISQEELDKLFYRFYKVDKSRASENGGSGMGLAIARTIVEMQWGSIWAECEGDTIRFLVSFTCYNTPEDTELYNYDGDSELCNKSIKHNDKI